MKKLARTTKKATTKKAPKKATRTTRTTYTITETLGPNNLNDVGGGEFTVTVANPLVASYEGLPKAGTELFGEHGAECRGPRVVLSVSDTGRIEVRPEGSDGEWERVVKQGKGLIVYRSGGRRFPLAFAE